MKFELPKLFGNKAAEVEKSKPNEVTSILQEAIGVSGESKPEKLTTDESDEQKTPE